MSLIKLYKQPSFGYGASQSERSRYECQEHHNMSQSSQVEHGWAAKPNHSSTYYGHAQGSQMGYDLLDDDLGYSLANNSTHQYAQAQTVLPMPSINVQQNQHTNGGRFSSPNRANHSGRAMVSNVEEGWTTKAKSIQTGGYGASIYKGQEANNYRYGRNGSANGGWANKPNGVSGPNHMGQSAQMVYGCQEQQGWANGPNKLSSSAQASVTSRKEEHMMGKMGNSWSGSPVSTNHSSQGMHKEERMTTKMANDWAGSPIVANHSSQAMHKEEHMMGKMGNGWSGSPVATNHSSQAMNKEERMTTKMGNDWAGSPVVANYSSQAMHKEEHIMENIDNGWATSPTNANHSSFAMHEEDQEWGASPTRASLSSLSMRKEEHMMGKTDNGRVASPTIKINHSSQAMMHKEDHKWAANATNFTGLNNNNNDSCQGWAGHRSNSFGPTHEDYNSNECDEDHGVDDILDEILTKYPAHNISNGPNNWATKPNLGGMGQTQASSYAKQEVWAQSAHSGASAQSSMTSSNVNNFAMSTGNRSHREYSGYQGIGNQSYHDYDD